MEIVSAKSMSKIHFTVFAMCGASKTVQPTYELICFIIYQITDLIWFHTGTLQCKVQLHVPNVPKWILPVHSSTASRIRIAGTYRCITTLSLELWPHYLWHKIVSKKNDLATSFKSSVCVLLQHIQHTVLWRGMWVKMARKARWLKPSGHPAIHNIPACQKIFFMYT